MHISKSQYLRYKQCHKSLWLFNNKSEIKDNNKALEDILEKGIKIGKAARELFPNGVEIEFKNHNFLDMAAETKKLIEKGVKTIYEPVFIYNDILAICDILHRDEKGWNIYEVKSSTQVKERHLDDIAIQYYVLKNSGLDINSANIIHINKEYTRNGYLDLDELFIIENQIDFLNEKLANIDDEVDNIKNIINDLEPSIGIGMHCEKYNKEDFECDFKGYCWSHIPDYSVFDIGGLRKDKKFELYNKGIINIKDIPDDYKMSESQQFQVRAIKENIEIINKNEIKNFLSDFNYPLYFLDFETYQQAIPEFDGIKAYQQIPFQYSLHILEDENTDLIHKEFLAKEGTDSRRALAENLVKDIPKDVCTVAYNLGFEKGVIRNLAVLFPNLKDHLMNIHDNMVDIMVPFQKKWYYTNDMKGSYSIKYVLPALFPDNDELNYKNLNIQNGSMAMNTFETLHEKDNCEIEKIRKDLLAYCKLDTLAMVRIWEELCNL